MVLYCVLTRCQNTDGGVAVVKKNIGPKLALFEFPTYHYLKTGDVLCKCLSLKGRAIEAGGEEGEKA